MLDDLSIVCLVVKGNDCAEVFEGRYFMSVGFHGGGSDVHTQLEVFFGTVHKLTNPCCKTFRENEVFAAVGMLSNKEAQNFDEVSVQRHFLYGQVFHCKLLVSSPNRWTRTHLTPALRAP